ncbi:MAG: GGDEF domain-containing protein [Pseudomonadota bacterium]
MDILTLLITITMLELAIFLAMLIFWRTQRTYPGFGHWTVCNLALLFGGLLLGLKDHIPVVLSEVLGNTLFALGGLLRLRGVRLFLGRPAAGRLDWLYPLSAAAGLAWFSFVQPSWPWRTMAISLPLAAMAIQAAWLLLRAPSSYARPLYQVTAATALLFMAMLMTRALVVLPMPAEAGLFTVNPWQTGYFLTGVVVEVVLNMAFAMMNSSRLAADLREAQAELARLAATDALTGALNRRSFYLAGAREVDRARRYGHPLTAVMVDLDGFKQVNDTYGHACGDRLLTELTRRCQQQLRVSDLLGRVGGDEFAVLLPETDLAGAGLVAERLRQATEHWQPLEDHGPLEVSLSLGITLLHRADEGLDDFLERADLALYEAKQAGRNRVVTMERVEAAEAAPPGGTPA